MPVSDIYLDHAASTVVRAESQAAWTATIEAHHANPTGAHKAARDARRALDDARDLIAELIGRQPAEVVFTSGGSEADNLAVRGVLGARGGTAVCSAGEHHAVLEPVEHAGGLTVGLNAKGQVTPEALADTLKAADDVSVVSIIAVNNETGAINDLSALSQVVREHAPGALLHTDAVQALSWIDLAAAVEDVDMVSITGHKVGAPIGTGVLFVRTGSNLRPRFWAVGRNAAAVPVPQMLLGRQPSQRPSRPRLSDAPTRSCVWEGCVTGWSMDSLTGSVRWWCRPYLARVMILRLPQVSPIFVWTGSRPKRCCFSLMRKDCVLRRLLVVQAVPKTPPMCSRRWVCHASLPWVRCACRSDIPLHLPILRQRSRSFRPLSNAC